MTKIYPRYTVSVTQEQYDLLSRLAELDPDTRTPSAYIRVLIDQVTPLLRATVPMMEAATNEINSSREQLRQPMRDFMAAASQLDLLDASASGAARTERSEGVRTKRRPRKNP